MRNHISIGALACVLACAAVLPACGRGARDGGSQASGASETDDGTPAQAANDAAAPPPDKTQLSYDPATAVGAVKGVPAPTNTAPIEAVANFFTELPGFDLSALDARKREKFLHRVNSEMCSCGCKNDTLAHCLVNDLKCPTVKTLVQAVYDEVKAGG